MKSDKRVSHFSLAVIIAAAILFGYITVKAFAIVQKRQISTGDGIYTNRVSLSDGIRTQAAELTVGCGGDRLCEVQHILDFVTAIPYHSEYFQANKPSKTIELNQGDCDDKSNLLISLLHSIGIDGYFVLVPEHIFVIVPLADERLSGTKALYLDGQPYYVLESTAKGSPVGFPLRYRISQIDMILDPFSNKKVQYTNIEYR